MDLGLTGKRAIVTGSTKGIGRAIAETLLDEGASVAICARDADGVAAAVKRARRPRHGVGQAPSTPPTASRCGRSSPTRSTQLGGLDIYVHNTSGKPARRSRRGRTTWTST